MWPQDGLQITVFMPALFMPLLALLLIGLVSAAAAIVWRRRRRWLRLTDELQAAKSRLAGRDDRPAGANPPADAYRHFIRDIAHEISNPLQSIQTNLDNMAHSSAGESGRWRQYHRLISAEVRRLATLTDNLRTLALLETPNVPLVREPVNIKAVIEDIIMAQAEEAERHRVRLRYVGPERPAKVLGDRDRLHQVLLNLVDNGIKYTKGDGGMVVFSMREQDERLWVHVSDDGIGIPPESLKHIGEDIYRMPDPRSLRRKSSGFGLAIATRIIKQHGGELRLRSQIGEGTTASFDLPIYVPGQTPQANQPL